MVLSESGKGLGRHGQALEPLNCVLDACWGRLRGFRRRLEANLGVLEGFESCLRVPKAGPGLVLRASREVVFGCFFGVLARSQAKIEN